MVLSISEKLHSFPGLPTQLEVTGWWLPFPKTLPFQKILVLSFLETLSCYQRTLHLGVRGGGSSLPWTSCCKCHSEPPSPGFRLFPVCRTAESFDHWVLLWGEGSLTARLRQDPELVSALFLLFPGVWRLPPVRTGLLKEVVGCWAGAGTEWGLDTVRTGYKAWKWFYFILFCSESEVRVGRELRWRARTSRGLQEERSGSLWGHLKNWEALCWGPLGD